MSIDLIIRAWKDEDFRRSLSEKQLAQLPEHPAGMIELSNADLGSVAGGDNPRDTHVSPYKTCTICPECPN